MKRPPLILASAILATLAPCMSGAAEYNPVAREPRSAAQDASASSFVDVIVKLRPDSASDEFQKLANGDRRVAALSKRTGLALDLKREISGAMIASRLILGSDSETAALERLRADPAVEFAVPDRRRYAHAVPNDPLFNGQWYLQNAEVSAVNATAAWDRELGISGVVVAVLDTGVRYDHPDLGRGDQGGKLLPGYDFVTGTPQANDGNGRDNDPTDPGDWVNDADKTANPSLANCTVTGSSWHGTRVAGMIGALTNNSSGVSGLSWNSFILPVRVLGKCGGTDSDILAGMRWAAGLTVNGVPANPTPARIINMSLGSESACEASYRAVIDELTARKVLVVISAGNEGTMVSSPGNCPGVASVAALRHAGSKVGFSNLGPEVTIGAPGGNCVNVNGGPCLFSLDTTSNSGTQAPATNVYTDQINSNLGTSFSAPIVTGIAALMVSRNANLSTVQLLARLREGARPFPATVAGEPNVPMCHVPVSRTDFQLEQCICTAATCGAGMANAANSLEAADRPIAAVALPGVVNAGQNVTLEAAGSAAACNRTVASFGWTVISPAQNPPVIGGANTSAATVTAPTSGLITLRVTVTDSQGRTDAADVIVGTNSATSTAPPNAGTTPCAAAITSGPTPGTPVPSPPPPSNGGGGGGGGGGGAFDLVLLGLLGVLIALSRRLARRFSRCN